MVGRRGRTTRQVSRDVQLRPQLIVSNLSERVPGELQTNNRGELLVRAVFVLARRLLHDISTSPRSQSVPR